MPERLPQQICPGTPSDESRVLPSHETVDQGIQYMKQRFIQARRLRETAAAMVLAVYDSPRSRGMVTWLVLLLGLITWIVIQSIFTVLPFWNRALPFPTGYPLTSILQAKETSECLSGDCPALTELRKQLFTPAADPEAARQQELAASVLFPPYSPLMSIILLGVSKLGIALTTAYKAIWTLWPMFCGLAIAALIAALWGPAAAGIVLMGCAFKVFPGETLQYVGPSNLAMGLAMLMLARIVSRKGDATWTLVIGSILLVAMHPIGRIYALTVAIVGWLVCEPDRGLKKWRYFFPAVCIVALAFFASAVVDMPFSSTLRVDASHTNTLTATLTSFSHSIEEIIGQVGRVESGIFGSLAFYFGALAFALFIVSPEEQAVLLKVLCVCVLFLFVPLFYGAGDAVGTFLMLLTPLLLIVFGGIGRTIWYTLAQALAGWATRAKDREETSGFSLHRSWPVLAFALLFGWALLVSVSATEELVAVSRQMRNQKPLVFDPTQPALLRTSARPGDAVLYTSVILMPYYFIYGALQYGAVYYHPALAGTEPTMEMLRRPALRFAVAYNPIVRHPDFEGMDETRWWTERARLRYSPLNKPKSRSPISREGMIATSEFRWAEVASESSRFPSHVSLLVDNPGPASYIDLIPVSRTGDPLSEVGQRTSIQAGWSGWLDFDLREFFHAARIRMVFPQGGARFLIGGIVFEKGRLRWPWAHKATLYLMPQAGDTDAISLSFDPAQMLPAPLNGMRISVLDDSGGAVLLKIDR